MEFVHLPVMAKECIDGLLIRPDGIYVDGTAGGAGHSIKIAGKLDESKGKLIAMDRDPDAIRTAEEKLENFPCATVVKSNYRFMDKVLGEMGIYGVDGILLDIGVSSYQMDNAERGFSYLREGNLDMRMDKHGMSAAELVNNYEKEELVRIFRKYGEEPYSKNIADNIIKHRKKRPIETTKELADIISESVPAKSRREKNPGKRVFQAIRIEINGELDALTEGLDAAFSVLKKEGRLVVITFHSLEDRIVKRKFKAWCEGCICPPDFPMCICENKPKAVLITKKPLLPSEEETGENRRSKSAKLRIIEKI